MAANCGWRSFRGRHRADGFFAERSYPTLFQCLYRRYSALVPVLLHIVIHTLLQVISGPRILNEKSRESYPGLLRHFSTGLSTPRLRPLFFDFERPRPAVDGDLARARQRQLTGRRVFGQRGAGADGGAAAHRHGRDQLGDAADEAVVFDHGARFVDAVVVAGDGAGADVDARTNGGVADVGQVVGLAVRGDLAVLDFDEIADVYVLGQLGARAQARVRSDDGGGPDHRAFDVAKRLDAGAGGDAGIDDDAVRADGDAVRQFDLAFEHAADIDADVASADQLAAHVDARRVRQRDATLQQRQRDIALMNALELGQLHLAVDASHFPLCAGLGRHDAHAVADGLGHDVGQVILALRVVVRQGRQPAFQVRGRRDHDAAVDFLDRPLGVGGVLFLDDGDNIAVFTDDATQSVGIILHHGQDAKLVATGRLDQAPQRGGRRQRHVAVQDQRRHAVVQFRQRLHDGVAGAQLRFLQCGGDRFGLFGEQIQHRCAPMSVNHA